MATARKHALAELPKLLGKIEHRMQSLVNDKETQRTLRTSFSGVDAKTTLTSVFLAMVVMAQELNMNPTSDFIRFMTFACMPWSDELWITERIYVCTEVSILRHITRTFSGLTLEAHRNRVMTTFAHNVRFFVNVTPEHNMYTILTDQTEKDVAYAQFVIDILSDAGPIGKFLKEMCQHHVRRDGDKITHVQCVMYSLIAYVAFARLHCAFKGYFARRKYRAMIASLVEARRSFRKKAFFDWRYFTSLRHSDQLLRAESKERICAIQKTFSRMARLRSMQRGMACIRAFCAEATSYDRQLAELRAYIKHRWGGLEKKKKKNDTLADKMCC